MELDPLAAGCMRGRVPLFALLPLDTGADGEPIVGPFLEGTESAQNFSENFSEFRSALF